MILSNQNVKVKIKNLNEKTLIKHWSVMKNNKY